MAVSGKCDPKFKRVGEVFESNFKEGGDVGATVCVTVEGETVVDLWGGIANIETGEPWKEDTVSIIWSSTKGCVGLCANILISRGLLDVDAPVTKYWPEYGKHGKENTTIKMLLNQTHSIPALRKPAPAGLYRDLDLVARALEEEEPWWEPGTRSDYGPYCFGWLNGEVIRRVSGKSLGRFFQDEVAKPLGIDFWIGLPEEIEPRVAKMIFPDMSKHLDNPFYAAVLTEPDSIPGLVFLNTGGHMQEFDAREGHAAEVGGGGGITNARGLAGMYAPLACGGSLKGVTLVDADTLAGMCMVSNASNYDMTLRQAFRFTTGFHKTIDNRRQYKGARDSCIWSHDAFGWFGFGGSVGFADPRERLSFGYSMNKMHPGTGLNPGSQALVDATFLSLGFRSNKSGGWLR